MKIPRLIKLDLLKIKTNKSNFIFLIILCSAYKGCSILSILQLKKTVSIMKVKIL